MSTYYSAPGLDPELDYRRRGLRRAAAEHRLVRQARRARAARRTTDGPRPTH
ncbi:MAG TPA: hypothetical protein VLM05_06755 [Mycobacteriales bacterium]|nr:hypothetical protein [Mycobacteriales bacterium]